MISSTTADSCETSKTCRLSSDFTTLRQSALFAGITLEVVTLFAYLSSRRSFQPQTYRVKQGEKALQSFLRMKRLEDQTTLLLDRVFSDGWQPKGGKV